MSQMHIERVDELPIILHWLIKMRVQVIIDAIWHPHRNWTGLSYGRLAVLFVTYVIHQRDHRLSCMEKWLVNPLLLRILFLLISFLIRNIDLYARNTGMN